MDSLNYDQKEKSTTVLLLGTNLGSIVGFDNRTGSLIFVCQNVITTPIMNIFITDRVLSLVSNNINLYYWTILDRNLQTFVSTLEKNA